MYTQVNVRKTCTVEPSKYNLHANKGASTTSWVFTDNKYDNKYDCSFCSREIPIQLEIKIRSHRLVPQFLLSFLSKPIVRHLLRHTHLLALFHLPGTFRTL